MAHPKTNARYVWISENMDDYLSVKRRQNHDHVQSGPETFGGL